MSLFEVPKRPTRENDKKVVSKSKQKAKMSFSVRGDNSLAGRINAIREMVNKVLGHLVDNYLLIMDEEELHKYISQCIKDGEVAIDTETTGLDTMRDELVGISLCSPTQKACYIPINHISYLTKKKVANQLPIDVIKQEFQRLKKAKLEVDMFNANFDLRIIAKNVGVMLKCTWDASLASRCLNENEPEGSKGLKPLHLKYVLKGEGDAFSFGDLFKGIPFNLIPIDVGFPYAAHDAEITLQLKKWQEPYLTVGCPECNDNNLEGVAKLFYTIEIPTVPVVVNMEMTGVDFDMEYNEKLKKKYHRLLKDKQNEIYDIIDEYSDELEEYKLKHPAMKFDDPINIGSVPQLKALLFDIIKVDPPEDNKGNPIYSTDKNTLPLIDHPIAEAIVEYRALAILVNTFIDKLAECVYDDGRIHGDFNQYGADTGRFSSENPNLQNIPSHNKDIRKMFKATDGYVMMSSDYSQQEPKVMARMCGDKKMIQACKDGKDMYAGIAEVAYNTTYENCLEFYPDGTVNKEGEERRSNSKSILLGILYDRGVDSIAEQLGTTKAKAQKIQDKIFKSFPAIPKFRQASLDMVKEVGYVTTICGRKRRLPIMQKPDYEFSWINGLPFGNDYLDFEAPKETDKKVPIEIQKKYSRLLSSAKWYSKKMEIMNKAKEEGIYILDNTKEKADVTRKVVNARIQGSAADMTKLAMIKISRDKKMHDWGFRLLIQVHDELIGECPIEYAKECKERFAYLMSKAGEEVLDMPINCDVEVSKCWYGERIEV